MSTDLRTGTGTGTTPALRSRWQLLALIPALAGLWLIASPFVLGFPHTYPYQPALLIAILFGSLVVLLSIGQGLWWSTGRSASRGVLVLGLLLLLSPLVFEYWHFRGPGSAATANSVLTGLVIVVGAAFCLAAHDADT